MNRQIIRFALIAAGAITLTATSALAQNLRGNIPFDFNASGMTLPAGTYEFTRQSATVPVWVIRNVTTKENALVVSASRQSRLAEQTANAELSFRCAGETCALQALYPAGSREGNAFNISPKVAPEVQVATIRRLTLTD